MSNRDHIISHWMEPQNNEFLKKAGCSYIFFTNKNSKYHKQPFALISCNSRKLKIFQGLEAEFHTTFSPNYGVYKGSCTIHPYIKKIHHYHSLYYPEYQYYKQGFTDKIQENQKPACIYIGINFLKDRTLLSITTTLANIDNQGASIFLIPVVFKL